MNRDFLFISRIFQPAMFLCGLLLCTVSSQVVAGTCGGVTSCQCGDTVTADHVMTYDIGPCPRLSGQDTVGVIVKSGITLDCQGHAIIGPGDNGKNAFGIRVGFKTPPAPTTGVTVRNCEVTRFWWGIYVQNARHITLYSNVLSENGWKDPRRNGTGYGLDVANSQFITVRNNVITDNGNEGIHLSHSRDVTVEGNTLADNGFEQLYLFFADDNTIHDNAASGGRQGLEMRNSNNNSFSYNIWADSAKQWLENDNTKNTFFYEHFAGAMQVSRKSTGNRFELCEFSSPDRLPCLRINAADNYVYKSRFSACAQGLRTSSQGTVDRSVYPDRRIGRATVIYPGCTADLDLDGDVDNADRAILVAALGSSIGAPDWNPEGDLDHDGDVDNDDVAALDAQLGPCEQ